jgi:hypothetical protein
MYVPAAVEIQIPKIITRSESDSYLVLRKDTFRKQPFDFISIQ